ncbi:recombinase family protein [Candidatus Babeliales bacterium]|nr:recombinase family protein [Candidatus Babeliales bacterium]
MGRSLKHLIQLVSQFEKQGIALKSLQENIDTGSASGKLIFHIFGALTEFECNLIKERTMAGLAAARARGKLGGRSKKLSLEKRQHIVKLYREKKYSVKEICNLMGISKPTLYSYLREENSSKV